MYVNIMGGTHALIHATKLMPCVVAVFAHRADVNDDVNDYIGA